MAKSGTKKLGELLIEAGMITQEQLDACIGQQKVEGLRLGEILINKGLINERQLLKTLEYQFRIPYLELSEIQIEQGIQHHIPETLAKKYTLIPIKKEGDTLTIAMADPLDFYALDDVKLTAGLEIKPVTSVRSDILNAIERLYGKETAAKAFEDLRKEYDITALQGIDDQFGDEINSAPVVRLVNSIIQHAAITGASDIHIEPLDNDMRVRFRIDGELQEVMKASKSAHPALITRIKIMGRMDIAEKRVPQDGRVETVIDDKEIDLRISILPTVNGEKVVIRLLGRADSSLTKQQIGFTPENMTLFEKVIKSPHGIILVSGPTGSGKTTTLYAVLKELNKITSNIITVEDPVEYRLDGISQVQVNTKAGLSFASGLRSILRQDPDIIMIGEIRDAETAQIAIRAAITGHLVLSTIHTNDAASSIARLVDMDIEPYLVSSSVVGVTAQRLVRKICTRCKTAYRPDHVEMMMLKLREPQTLYKGAGCPACNYTGYSKRTAIHEVLVVTREIRELIDRRATVDQIRQIAIRLGTTTLRDNCTKLVLDGVTTTEELVKVTYSVD